MDSLQMQMMTKLWNFFNHWKSIPHLFQPRTWLSQVETDETVLVSKPEESSEQKTKKNRNNEKKSGLLAKNYQTGELIQALEVSPTFIPTKDLIISEEYNQNSFSFCLTKNCRCCLLDSFDCDSTLPQMHLTCCWSVFYHLVGLTESIWIYQADHVPPLSDGRCREPQVCQRVYVLLLSKRKIILPIRAGWEGKKKTQQKTARLIIQIYVGKAKLKKKIAQFMETF